MKTRTRRAFTLVELLVVIAIIAALSALVLPGLLTRRSTTSVADAEEVLTSAVSNARARSQRSGQASSVRLRTDGQGRIEVLVAGGVAPSSEDERVEGDSRDAGAADPEEVIGVIRTMHTNGGEGEPRTPGSLAGREPGLDAAAPGEVTTLAVFTPDGSVHPAPPAPLAIGNEGATLKVAVDSFGVVRIHERSIEGEGGEEFMGELGGGGGEESSADLPRGAEGRGLGRVGLR